MPLGGSTWLSEGHRVAVIRQCALEHGLVPDSNHAKQNHTGGQWLLPDDVWIAGKDDSGTLIWHGSFSLIYCYDADVNWPLAYQPTHGPSSHLFVCKGAKGARHLFSIDQME